MFTDTHCHISKKDYENIEEIIENAQEKGIHRLINNGSNMETNKEVLTLSHQYENLFPAIGIHPDSVGEYNAENISFIEKHIQEIVAIGEIGLDYHYDNTEKEKQIALFEAQLKLAEKYNKPVIVHSRDATEDTIKILRKYPKVKGSIHCFSGSYETAKIYIAMGYKLGFNGVVTFKNAKIKEVIKKIPTSAILLETDCPYLAPIPVRGTKNEPKNVHYIADFISQELGISIEKLSEITEANVANLFLNFHGKCNKSTKL